MIRAARCPLTFIPTCRLVLASRTITRIAGTQASKPFEEERLPWYSSDQFYPVRIGEVLQTRYKVVGKLGYGAHSTVWLCRSIPDSDFVAVKVCTRRTDGLPHPNREVQFYEHLSSIKSQHPGQRYIRGLIETFELDGPTGQHLCLVQPPMHMTIRQLQYQNSSHRLNNALLRWTLRNVITALSFLHDEAAVVHADLNPANIMMTIDDKSLLTKFEEREEHDPSETKVIDETRTIYASRQFDLPDGLEWGRPVLCDFGEARIGHTHKGLIQPELYRAPEVLFDMECDSSVDIWNVAVLIWDLFENRHHFNALDNANKPSATGHVVEMVAYLGYPSLDYLARSQVTRRVFDDQGAWKCSGGTVVPDLSLERAELVLNGDDKEAFLAFVRSMLTWKPEERPRATDLLANAWLQREDP